MKYKVTNKANEGMAFEQLHDSHSCNTFKCTSFFMMFNFFTEIVIGNKESSPN